MNRARIAFLETTDVAIGLMRMPEVQARWEEPSALEAWSVSGLAGHLVRNTAGVETYLDADPAPSGTPISPAAYYAGAVDPSDVSSDENRAIRARGDQMASVGYETLVAEQQAVADRLRERLSAEPPTRKIKAFMDMVLLLDDFLVTRIVELTCHIDDLAVSVGVPTPSLPLEGLDIAIRAMVSVGRHRHGDLAVIRALARKERDTVDALRVF